MACTQPPKNRKRKSSRSSGILDQSGIALFMVIGAISVLAVLVTEFTTIAQVGQQIAYGGLDQTKAHYLAKSGLKLSLLRLKAYKQVKEKAASFGVAVPKSMLEKIWSFPIFYPFPTLPGMTGLEKESIEKFNKDTSMDGSFTMNIDAETSKYNLNMLLSAYAPVAVATSTPSPPPAGGLPPPTGALPNATPTPTFNPEVARASLADYLEQILKNRTLSDPDFADEYRDFRIHDLVDHIAGWADRTYERHTSSSSDKFPMKKAPFYSVSELHMVPTMDDQLYELFAPNLTARVTSEINVNTLKEPTLVALIPSLTKDEIKEFFKFRDAVETDGQFKKVEDFYGYLNRSVAAYQNNAQAITELQDSFKKRNIILVTEETEFKITVRAQAGQSVRILEAWVSTAANPVTPPKNDPNQPPPGQPSQGGQTVVNTGPPDTGLRITYMRIL